MLGSAPTRAEDDVAVASTETVSDAAASEEAADAEDADPVKTLCELIEASATEHEIPVGFFTRLLWKESRFRGDAVSPKGAQGIAQFMPGTAAERGLDDPFDAETAIPASASLLSDLNQRFGNLGLAAAAYNAGADRVSGWLEDDGSLPFETQDYVLTITGLPAETWADVDDVPELPAEPADAKDCVSLAALLKARPAALTPDFETASAPWGVQVAGNFSKARAIAAYQSLQKRFPSLLDGRAPMVVSGRMSGRGPRAFYRMRVPVETQAEGKSLCAKLRAAGGSCIVLKS